MYLFFLAILLLPMLALKPRRAEDGDVLDAKSTTCIKGILCIYVMLHNLGLDLDNGEFKELVCEHAGGVGVGVAVSADVGLHRSLLAAPTYFWSQTPASFWYHTPLPAGMRSRILSA